MKRVGVTNKETSIKKNRNVALNYVNNIAEIHFMELVEHLGRINNRYIKKNKQIKMKILFFRKTKFFKQRSIIIMYYLSWY